MQEPFTFGVSPLSAAGCQAWLTLLNGASDVACFRIWVLDNPSGPVWCWTLSKVGVTPDVDEVRPWLTGNLDGPGCWLALFDSWVTLIDGTTEVAGVRLWLVGCPCWSNSCWTHLKVFTSFLDCVSDVADLRIWVVGRPNPSRAGCCWSLLEFLMILVEIPSEVDGVRIWLLGCLDSPSSCWILFKVFILSLLDADSDVAAFAVWVFSDPRGSGCCLTVSSVWVILAGRVSEADDFRLLLVDCPRDAGCCWTLSASEVLAFGFSTQKISHPPFGTLCYKNRGKEIHI